MKKKKTRKRKLRQPRRGEAKTPVCSPVQPASAAGKAHAPSGKTGEGRSHATAKTTHKTLGERQPLTPFNWFVVATWSVAILTFFSGYSQMLSIVQGLVTGYREVYSSIWRSLAHFLPDWARPFDAPQTYDAITFIAIMAASLFGARHISKKDQLYDLAAAGLLSFLLQTATIRLWDRTPYDVVATTTVNLVILGLSVGAAIGFRLMPEFRKRSVVQWSPLLMAVGTLFMMVLDQPMLFVDTLKGDISPALGVDIHAMQHVLWTSLVLTNLGGAVFFLYAFRGPRRPLLVYAIGLASCMYIFASLGGIVERALQDADVIPAPGAEAPPVQ